MLPLFDEQLVAPQPIKRITHDSPEAFAFWTAFKRGAEGQGPPAPEADEDVTRYAKDGYRIGRLFTPLPCMRDAREQPRNTWRR